MLIKIKNFRIKTILGIYQHEQNVLREVIINAVITTNYDNARFTNDIKDTIDYDEIISKIKNLLTNKNFRLIEEMSQQILDLIMQDKRIKRCELEADKVGVVENVESFSIVLVQENN